MTASHLTPTLAARGIKPTALRLLILKAMLGFEYAFSLGDLETALDTVDKSTISRTLRLFHENGLIHSFDDGSGATKYSLCQQDCTCSINDLHAHFHCNYCQKSFCLQNVPLPKIPLPIPMEAESINLVVKGFCGNCRKIAT